MYNYDSASLARSGRWAEVIGDAIGSAIATIVKVVFWKVTLTVYAITTAMQALTFGMRKPASKFCYFKCTMVNYWTAVTAAVNQIATYKGMYFFNNPLTNPDNDNSRALKEGTTGQESNEDLFKTFSSLMPDIYKDGFIDGFIDVYAIANRTQRIKNYVDDNINDLLKNGGNDEVIAYTLNMYKLDATTKLVMPQDWKGYKTLKKAIEGWMNVS